MYIQHNNTFTTCVNVVKTSCLYLFYTFSQLTLSFTQSSGMLTYLSIYCTYKSEKYHVKS